MAKVVAEIAFLGTGTSEGIPRVSCLTQDPVVCSVCRDSMRHGSKNRRGNTSLIIKTKIDDQIGRARTLLIDCGKYFWNSAMRWFPVLQVRHLDAVLITHEHNDAAYGIDDLRDWTSNVTGNKKLDIWVRKPDFAVLEQAFPYLVTPSQSSGGGNVARVDWNIIVPPDAFVVHGVHFTPLCVPHGKGDCLAFLFEGIAYVSDVSRIPDDVRASLRNCQLLIVDMLRPHTTHPSHFVLPETLAEIRQIRPQRTLLIGMNHDVDHDLINAELAELSSAEGLHVELAFDGMRIEWNA